VDTGAENVGVTVISGKQELNSYEFKLRKDVSQKVQERKMYRRNRRSRLRYRKPRFKNRASSRKKGSLAPGVQEKVDAHCRMINLFQQRLPESTLILETGAFDTQKLQDPSIQGVGYQKGVQYGFANVKQYVLSRDQHHCQAGKGGCSKKLQVHHITFRSEGGSDAPDNLITLCDKHHKALHDGKLPLEVKKHRSLKSERMMGKL
jgi:N6-L-threonylcarbamoyladenine synthase